MSWGDLFYCVNTKLWEEHRRKFEEGDSRRARRAAQPGWAARGAAEVAARLVPSGGCHLQQLDLFGSLIELNKLLSLVV